MQIVRYGGRYPKPTLDLQKLGLLLHGQFPRQKAVYPYQKEGVDITYRLQKVTPQTFATHSDLFLETALKECLRYKGIPDIEFFAKFEVLVGNKGRTLRQDQTYTAAQTLDPEVMVNGPDYPTPGFESFLKDKVEQIIDIPRKYSKKFRNPTFSVTKLIIGMRVKVLAPPKEASE